MQNDSVNHFLKSRQRIIVNIHSNLKTKQITSWTSNNWPPVSLFPTSPHRHQALIRAPLVYGVPETHPTVLDLCACVTGMPFPPSLPKLLLVFLKPAQVPDGPSLTPDPDCAWRKNFGSTFAKVKRSWGRVKNQGEKKTSYNFTSNLMKRKKIITMCNEALWRDPWRLTVHEIIGRKTSQGIKKRERENMKRKLEYFYLVRNQ